MRRLKKGFTLAEVLITLGIIGVVAAIVMPSVITSYQYKTIGVKLSKFASQTENTTRPFVVQNDSFRLGRPQLVTDFYNDSYIYTDIYGVDAQNSTNVAVPTVANQGNITGLRKGSLREAVQAMENQTGGNTSANIASTDSVTKLKDGTYMRLGLIAQDSEATVLPETGGDITVDYEKVGEPVFAIEFDPAVTGLPDSVQKTFTFVVTELGYVYPHGNDGCLEAIYQADFASNANTFRENINAACTTTSTQTSPGAASSGS